MISRRKRRGTILLSLAAILLVLGTMSALVLVRSLEVYRDGAQAKWRLQAQSAAEGAAITLEATGLDLQEPLTIGHARVTAESGGVQGKARTVFLEVDVLGKAENVLLSRRYIARYTLEGSESGPWILVGVGTR